MHKKSKAASVFFVQYARVFLRFVKSNTSTTPCNDGFIYCDINIKMNFFCLSAISFVNAALVRFFSSVAIGNLS